MLNVGVMRQLSWFKGERASWTEQDILQKKRREAKRAKRALVALRNIGRFEFDDYCLRKMHFVDFAATAALLISALMSLPLYLEL